MEFRHIEYFLTTSEHKSITKAAEALYISQQALSRCIQHLETEFGCSLFTRTARGSTLTEEGQYLYEKFKPLVENYHSAEQAAAEHLLGLKKKISFVTMPYVMGMVFPDALFSFKEKHPSFELEPREAFERKVVEYVLEDPSHFGFMVKPEQWNDNRLQFLTIRTYPLYLYVHKNHPLAKRSAVSFAELKEETFLLLEKGSFQQDIVYVKSKEAGFTPKIAYESADVNQLMSLVNSGRGIYIAVPVDAFIPYKNAVPVRFSDEDMLFHICFVAHNFDRLEPQNRKFIEYMKEMAAERP